MAYIWKTINYPTATPSTGQHYTAPVVNLTDDGSLLLIQQLITNTSTAGPYSITSFFVGFDAFGNTSPFIPQTTVTSAPNVLPNASALAAYQASDQYRVTFPGNSDGGVTFFVSGDGSNWIINRNVVTTSENSNTVSISHDVVDTTPNTNTVLTMFAASRGTGEYGVAYVVENGSGQVNLLWQGYNANNSEASGSPVSLSHGFATIDSTPSAAVNSGAGAFYEVHETIDGSNFHYLTYDAFLVSGAVNTNIGGGTGEFTINMGNTTVLDITEIRTSQFFAGTASGAYVTVDSELRTDGKYHAVSRFTIPNVSTNTKILSTNDVAQHVQVSRNDTNGTTVVAWADANANGPATFQLLDSSGNLLGSTFQAGDSTTRMIGIASLQDGRIEVSFQKTINAGTQTTSDVIYIIDTRTPGQTLDYSSTNTGDRQDIAGTSGADRIIASDNDFTYIAGAGGNDVYEFNALKFGVGFADDQITDYRQGNTGHYSATEADKIDISGLTGGSSINGIVHVFDMGDKGTFLAVDPNGATGGYNYWGIAELDGIHSGQTVNVITNSAAPAGVNIGVESNQGYAGNFNAGSDNNSDLIWFNDTTRAIKLFELNGNSSGNQIAANLSVSTLPTGWHISGVGDFNNDGNSDLLIRSDAGAMKFWEMNGATVAHNINAGTLPFGWQVKGVGDFNHDNISDIVIQNEFSGLIKLWEFNGHASGAQLLHNLNVSTLPSNWGIIGVGDFNGDNNDDLLLRLDTGQIKIWEMNGNASGGQILANLNASSLALNWHIEGIGDFNNDGKSDMLLVGDTGALKLWEMNGATIAHNLNAGTLTSTQHVAGTGDFNGDGVDDILLRYDNGETHLLELTGAASGNQVLGNQLVTTLDGGWSTQNHHYDMV